MITQFVTQQTDYAWAFVCVRARLCLKRDLATVRPLCLQVADIAWECLPL